MESNLLTFPRLGIELELNRVAFSVFGINIYWYGIIIATGIILGTVYALSRAKRFGVDPDRMIDVILWGGIASIVFARAYYVIFSWDYYKDHLDEIVKVWHGGLAIYGALIGAVLVGMLVAMIRRVKILPALDCAAGGFLLGQAIGRWGNFVNIEAFGSNTSLPWGMSGPKIVDYLTAHQAQLAADHIWVYPEIPVHPTFFYESIWCLIGFLFLAWFTKRRRYDGQMILMYAAWYGLGRFFIEGLRTDSLMWGSVRVSQALAGILFVVSVAILAYMHYRIQHSPLPNYLPLYVNTEDGQKVVAGTYYDKPENSEEPAPDAAGEEKVEMVEEIVEAADLEQQENTEAPAEQAAEPEGREPEAEEPARPEIAEEEKPQE